MIAEDIFTTPNQKAHELLKMFDGSKVYALKAADVVINSWEEHGNKRLDQGTIYWWKKVKKEIETL